MIILRENKFLIEVTCGCGLDGLIRMKKALHSLLMNIDTTNQTDAISEDITQIGWLLDSMEFSLDQVWKIEQAILKNTELAMCFSNPIPDGV